MPCTGVGHLPQRQRTAGAGAQCELRGAWAAANGSLTYRGREPRSQTTISRRSASCAAGHTGADNLRVYCHA